ncbi:MAG TPA: DNA mismatch repair protein MutS, partial [Ferruginibacter sp.]|nr:DNA mismatch repair protein MutS [Ferruginibacter sp.]
SLHSFGIHVARMAGMPPALIERANNVLAELEEKNKTNGTIKDRIKDITLPKMQLSIFDAQSQTFEEIRLLLESTDINRLTPVEALLKLQEIKNKIQ